MNRRQFLASSPAFLAALALSAKAVGALPVGFPDEAAQKFTATMWFTGVPNPKIIKWSYINNPIEWLPYPTDMVG